jgi:hypothetical protein
VSEPTLYSHVWNLKDTGAGVCNLTNSFNPEELLWSLAWTMWTTYSRESSKGCFPHEPGHQGSFPVGTKMWPAAHGLMSMLGLKTGSHAGPITPRLYTHLATWCWQDPSHYIWMHCWRVWKQRQCFLPGLTPLNLSTLALVLGQGECRVYHLHCSWELIHLRSSASTTGMVLFTSHHF